MSRKNIRVRGWIADFLEEVGEADTLTIYLHLLDRTAYPPTMNQLANILAKYPTYQKSGHVYGGRARQKSDGNLPSGWSVATWRLSSAS